MASEASPVAPAGTGKPTLVRSIGTVQLTLYGLGSMLGAGIYGLVGEAAGVLGSAIWIGFVVSMVAALLTGLSYASIASRYPKAAGAAYVVHRAYGRPLLSYVVGLAVACSGLTSIATQSNVVARNLIGAFGLEGVPVSVLALGFLLLVAGILFRGIAESLWANAVCTVVEAAGLLFVIAVGISWWGEQSLLEFPPGDSGAVDASLMLLVLQGAILTFFSFIGFEDTINVAEEVKDPERTVPIALIASMLAATAIYMAIAVTAVSVLPWRELAAADGPLTAVVARAAPWFPGGAFTAITIFAVSNTALVNYVMASRLLYGMSRQGLLPAALGTVHPVRRTPVVAIAVLFVIAGLLALIGNIATLASATVLLLLTVFVVVNGALLVLKRRPGERRGRFEVPAVVPILGALVCLVLIVARVASGDWVAPVTAAVLLVLIALTYALFARGQSERLAAFIEQDARE